MPDLGNYQLQKTDATRLCEVVSSVENLERTKIATKLYGGGYLMQTVGVPARILTLRLRAWSESERSATSAAEAACTPVVVKLGSTMIRGVLLDAPDWTAVVPGIYESTAKMVVSES